MAHSATSDSAAIDSRSDQTRVSGQVSLSREDARGSHAIR
jgi:hypothetical protein